MPVAYNSTISSQILIASGEPGAADDYELVNQTSETLASMGQIAGVAEGTAVTALVDATAFGTDTLATVAGTVVLADTGPASSLSANLDALAVAQGSDNLTFASTQIEVSLVSGDGSVISVAHDVTLVEIEDGVTTAMSSSSLAMIAILIDPSGSSFAELAGETTDPTALPGDADMALLLVPDELCGCIEDLDADLAFEIDGNLATFDLAVVAAGDDSYAELLADAFVLEDTMSTVTVVITASID